MSMSQAIVLPDLGAGADESNVRISAWLAEPGEMILQGDRIVELLIPGMTFDVPAPVSGRLTRIDKFLDAAVSAGDVLGWIEPEPD